MSAAERRSMVEAIHDSKTMLVLAVAGGGNAVITDLLDVPGASRTIIEIRVPYATAAMAALLAKDDDEPFGDATIGAVSHTTAETMAEACLSRARELDPENQALIGVACTAALVTDRPKKGDHRAHIAVSRGGSISLRDVADPMTTVQVKVELEKGARDRAGEDRVVADEILRQIAIACGVAAS